MEYFFLIVIISWLISLATTSKITIHHKVEHKDHTVIDNCGCKRYVDDSLGLNVLISNCKKHETK